MLVSAHVGSEHEELPFVELDVPVPPIVTAAEMGDVDSVASLLSGGANVSEENSIGWTALMKAAYYGRTAVARMLLEAGADAGAATTFETLDTPLILAASQGRTAVVRLLLSDARGRRSVGVVDASGCNALLWAALGGHADVIDALLGAGADPNAELRGGKRPLAAAAARGHVAALKRLLAGSADAAARDRAGKTAADHASSGEVKSLLAEAAAAAAAAAAGARGASVDL
jgi:ankyrin repeat protein